MTRRPLPSHITLYAADFYWDSEKLWRLDIPTEQMSVDELSWHFDIPWLHTPGGRFNLTPRDIMQHPDIHPEEYARTMRADVSYPIDVMHVKGRWLILDGLHRLMQLVDAGETQVAVRKVTSEHVPLIEVF